MVDYPQPIKRLIEAFSTLPGIGPKSAERLAFHIISMPRKNVLNLSQSLLNVKDNIFHCSVCNNLTDVDPCYICRDERRDKKLICVVQQAKDLIALEKIGDYKGSYHVLHGAISPMDGVGPEELNINKLIDRIKEGEVEEIILATNPTVEGEATAMYISKAANPLNIRVTRLAYGLPMGGDLEYADEMTLSKALEGRKDF
ncbi:recombination mediator RecR [Natranaerofaba carboxydovora]|uniref:recombination mediator RecR n=1 Tax=Natranaerofaba carboxydovora TaxID=2742683 RepID=UPI001F136E4B|nr:recombination mediator RecR [Natranaerofaba carboxydovora]UMZ75220.1 Recombination protein RecR [Natranaerofaba carboxydovora]